MTDVPPSIRVHKGNPDEHELAALAAVLLVGGVDNRADEVRSDRKRATAPWQWPERAGGFDDPRSWLGGL